jgi:ketosteroid isomerase-like protein
MSRENVEIVRRVFEEFRAGIESGDPGASWDAGLITADSEWIMPEPFEGRTVWRGREGFVELAQSWLGGEFESWSIRLERLIDAGDDRVVALIHSSARGKASGATIEAKTGVVYQLRDRRVIRMWVYFNHAEALEAAGLQE